jgi:hypothetical protein
VEGKQESKKASIVYLLFFLFFLLLVKEETPVKVTNEEQYRDDDTERTSKTCWYFISFVVSYTYFPSDLPLEALREPGDSTLTGLD